MDITDVQEIGQVTEVNDKPHAVFASRREIRLDVIVRSQSSPTSPPFDNSHQHQSEQNQELSFG
jgi:hypothetical protein